MSTKKLLSFILFLLIPIGVFGFEDSGIIYNSTVSSEQQIALGIRKEGQMGAYNGNIARNARATGIAYKFDGSRSQGYLSGWNDATTPGCLCEGWGAGFVDRFGRRTHGRANQAVGGVSNIEVKGFVIEETSITSTVMINDSRGQPALEVIHRFGPAANVPGVLFQALVTMTNISGNTLTDVRYNRTMDWDIPLSEFREVVTIKGTQASAASVKTPKVLNSGNNGFMLPNPFYPGPGYRGHTKWPKRNQVNKDYNEAGPADHGFTATFGFGELVCGQAHTFMIYYGAAANKTEMEAAFATEGVPLYSIGESDAGSINYYTNWPISFRDRYRRTASGAEVAYGFGFKGVSGSAIAPSLPTKIAALPAGNTTNDKIVQTYASPVIVNNHAYQAVFKFRQDHQWEGDILRYELDDDGDFKDTTRFPPVSAAAKFKNKNIKTIGQLNSDIGNFSKESFTYPGRNIWTVGYDPNCPGDTSKPLNRQRLQKIYEKVYGGSSRKVLNLNNFKVGTSESASLNLDELIYNCSTAEAGGDYGHAKNEKLVNFVRGYDSYGEDPGEIRQSLLGDTFHSDLVYVGAPDGSLSSSNSKTEAYFRNANGYKAFKETNQNRSGRLYVGANDGMLHAFDKNLNEVWAFIPPSILPKLRGLVGESGKSNTQWLVDGPIIVKDVYINATSEWKTLLVGGLGWGGNGYYVLDITDAFNPKHLFTIDNDVKNKQVSYYSESGYKTTYDYAAAPDNLDYSGLGKTWARPSIILLPYNQGKIEQKYVMAFGAGYAGGASTELGNFVYVLDFEPSSTTFSDPVTGTRMPTTNGGNVIKKIAITPDSASDIPNGVTAHMSVVTADAASTANFWGGIAYFPDLTGQVWKLDMSKTSLGELNSSMWTLTKVFKAEGTLANDRFGYNQMATTLLESTDPVGTYLFNFFGTGDQAHIQRRDVTIKNRIYGVRDLDFPGTDLAKTGSSKTISSTGVINLGSTACYSADVPGWYSDVSTQTDLGDFTRVIGRAALSDKKIYFSIYRPEARACPLTGTSQFIEISDGCGGVSENKKYEGLITAPVIDNRGNIYVGVGNLAEGKKIGEDGVGNITKAKDGAEEISEEGVDWKSWQENTY